MISLTVTASRRVALVGAMSVVAGADVAAGHRPGWGLAALGVVVVNEGITTFLDWRGLRDRAANQYEADLQACLGAALIRLGQRLDLPWQEVAVHAFYAQNRWPLRPRLVNIGSIRIGGKPRMDRPRWVPGKGVVGQAFADKEAVVIDWAEFYRAARVAGERAWTARSHRARFGLTWKQLQATADYRGLAACPVFDPLSERPIGCIVVDGPITDDQVDGTALDETLSDVSALVQRVGIPPREWLARRN